VSSESCCDFARFAVDGTFQYSISGENNWQQKAYAVPAGVHTLRWTYSKDGSVVSGSDRAWLDSVSYLAPEIPPVLVNQPTNQIILAGGTAVFRGSSVGHAPLRYQWQRSGIDLIGSTNAVLTLTNAELNDTGEYSLIVSNDFGAVTSRVALLELYMVPQITQSPAPALVMQGSNATFSVTAAGTAPLSYQWHKAGSPLASATNMSFTIANCQLADAGNFTVVVTNLAGAVTSAPVTLVVFPWDVNDSDGDGLKNWEENLAGTDPNNPQSFLKMEASRSSSGEQTILSFEAVSNRTYTVLFLNTLRETNNWQVLARVALAPTNRPVAITNALNIETQRFYRITTP
jgi:hypothetical protein